MQKEPTKKETLTNGKAELAELVAEVIAEAAKKNPKEPAQPVGELSPSAQALIAVAARSLPTWAKYGAGGVIGAILSYLAVFLGMPERMDKIEQTQKNQGA